MYQIKKEFKDEKSKEKQKEIIVQRYKQAKKIFHIFLKN